MQNESARSDVSAVAAYIAELAASLERVAANAKLAPLAYFLSLAAAEAAAHSGDQERLSG